jgi:hypothetical protein
MIVQVILAGSLAFAAGAKDCEEQADIYAAKSECYRNVDGTSCLTLGALGTLAGAAGGKTYAAKVMAGAKGKEARFLNDFAKNYAPLKETNKMYRRLFDIYEKTGVPFYEDAYKKSFPDTPKPNPGETSIAYIKRLDNNLSMSGGNRKAIPADEAKLNELILKEMSDPKDAKLRELYTKISQDKSLRVSGQNTPFSTLSALRDEYLKAVDKLVPVKGETKKLLEQLDREVADETNKIEERRKQVQKEFEKNEYGPTANEVNAAHAAGKSELAEKLNATKMKAMINKSEQINADFREETAQARQKIRMKYAASNLKVALIDRLRNAGSFAGYRNLHGDIAALVRENRAAKRPKTPSTGKGALVGGAAANAFMGASMYTQGKVDIATCGRSWGLTNEEKDFLAAKKDVLWSPTKAYVNGSWLDLTTAAVSDIAGQVAKEGPWVEGMMPETQDTLKPGATEKYCMMPLVIANPGEMISEARDRFGKVPEGLCKIISRDDKSLDQLMGDDTGNPVVTCESFKDAGVITAPDSATRKAQSGETVFSYRDEHNTYKAPWNEDLNYPDFKNLEVYGSDGKVNELETAKFQRSYGLFHPPSLTETRPDVADMSYDCKKGDKKFPCFLRTATMQARVASSITASACEKEATAGGKLKAPSTSSKTGRH